jgi:hypothetical protein
LIGQPPGMLRLGEASAANNLSPRRHSSERLKVSEKPNDPQSKSAGFTNASGNSHECKNVA